MSPELHMLLGCIFMSVVLGGVSLYAGIKRRRGEPLPTKAVAKAAAVVQTLGVVAIFAGLLPSGGIVLVAGLVAVSAYAVTPVALKLGAHIDTGMRAGRRS